MNNASDTTPVATPVTLESIAQQKAALLQQIHTQKEIMTGMARDIVAPVVPATNKANVMMRAFNTGMAVFDGVMLGIKFMRQFRNFLGGRRGGRRRF